MHLFGDQGWHTGWMLIWSLVPIALIVGGVWLATRRSDAGGGADQPSAEEILRRRYAAGEIDRDTFERMLEDLRKL